MSERLIIMTAEVGYDDNIKLYFIFLYCNVWGEVLFNKMV